MLTSCIKVDQITDLNMNVLDFLQYPAPGVSRCEDGESSSSRPPGALPEGFVLQPSARSLLIRLLEPEPRARLRSLMNLQQQAFFKGFSFEDARAKKVDAFKLERFPNPNVKSFMFLGVVLCSSDWLP